MVPTRACFRRNRAHTETTETFDFLHSLQLQWMKGPRRSGLRRRHSVNGVESANPAAGPMARLLDSCSSPARCMHLACVPGHPWISYPLSVGVLCALAASHTLQKILLCGAFTPRARCSESCSIHAISCFAPSSRAAEVCPPAPLSRLAESVGRVTSHTLPLLPVQQLHCRIVMPKYLPSNAPGRCLRQEAYTSFSLATVDLTVDQNRAVSGLAVSRV